MVHKKIQLKDIAREVGVSTATVSYVLNDHPMSARISEDVSTRIRQTALDLNYQPNQIAKSLKTQKTYTIGLIVADIANPFSAHMARIIEDDAKKKGYTVIFGSSDENINKAQNLINTMFNRQIDGLILAAVDKSQSQIADILKKGVPLVLIDRYFPMDEVSYVGIDNYHATYEAVELLIRNGRKRIGLISYDTELVHLSERNRGYMDALRDSGIAPDNALIKTISLHQIRHDVERGLAELLQAEPAVDAVLFTTNLLSINGLRYLYQQKIAIPDQLAVVAFDETDVYDFFPISITYVRQPLDELGRAASEALISQMENKTEQAVKVNLKTTLVVGQSSG
ncbi:MAG: substrate-binding domain-containing protein [Chitinophagales bacterium]|nr:substrate-binding domain-containing protein [Chitinophagales bacterium]